MVPESNYRDDPRIVAGAFTLGGARHNRTEIVDFSHVVRATRPAFDARLAPASDAGNQGIQDPDHGREDRDRHGSMMALDVWRHRAGAGAPRPTGRPRPRQRRQRVPDAALDRLSRGPHSGDIAYRMIIPRDSIAFEFTAGDPGAYMVHCGTPPVTMHLMQGMYFAIIVDPKGGWGTKADKEFVLVQSEFYAKPGDTTHAPRVPSLPMQPDWKAAMAKSASHVVFNGRAFQYKEHPLLVDVGDRVRFFVVDAGPTFDSDFHVVGAIFDRVYPDADPGHASTGVQTYAVPAGGGAVFETVFDKDRSGEGIYAFVTHSFADAEKGAVGLIQVGTPKMYARMSH